MSDLLTGLGLEFVDPYSVNTGLKQLKPQDEPQIFSVITSIPGLPNTVIKFPQHYFEQLKKKIRCHGGSCCIKAAELKEALAKLPDDDKRKRQDGKRQIRYILPVVLYQGKSPQSYGGPIEVRYLDISGFTYSEWDSAREAVNAEIAPFYERDFILTKKSPQMPSAQMHHLESRAKWLTDPTLHAEVQKIISAPDFVENYIKVIPPKMTEEEFLSAWNNAMSQQTVAEKALNTNNITPAVAMHTVSTPFVMQQAPLQEVASPEILPGDLDMNVMHTPVITAAQSTVPPQGIATTQSTVPEPAVANVPTMQQTFVQQQVPTQQIPAQQQVPINTGMPMTQAPATNPSTNVPFTPQNIITGAYSTGTSVSSIAPEAIVNMQPVQLAPAEAVQSVTSATPATANPAVEATPSTSQAEISLADVGDLDAIINSLQQ